MSALCPDILEYNRNQTPGDRQICDLLAREISLGLPEAESKIWHRHPVWFLNGNPIVGYSKLKVGIRLMFWSGADFDEIELKPGTGKFKDASIIYTSAGEVARADIKRWLQKSKEIQWDYKNLVMRKGTLKKLT